MVLLLVVDDDNDDDDDDDDNDDYDGAHGDILGERCPGAVAEFPFSSQKLPQSRLGKKIQFLISG